MLSLNLAKIWARDMGSEKGGGATRLPLPTPHLGAHIFAHLVTCTKFCNGDNFKIKLFTHFDIILDLKVPRQIFYYLLLQ